MNLHSTNYFLIVKHGDYNGCLILINKDGKIANLEAGGYFITADKHYLFGEYESDTFSTGFLIFDVQNNHIVFQSPELTVGTIKQWYTDGSGCFYTVENFDAKPEDDNWVYEYSFANKKILRVPAKDRLKKAKKIQLNTVHDPKSAMLLPS